MSGFTALDRAVVSRFERLCIGAFVGLGCLLLATVAAWWSVAALSLYTNLPLGDPEIARAALGGLLVGFVLDLLFLRRWVDHAYSMPRTIIATLCVAGSAMACAAFMGMPFGNLALGTLGGAYCGRRATIASIPAWKRDRLRKTTSAFTTCVTSTWAVPFAILALKEGMVQGIVTRLLGWSRSTTTGAPGVALMLVVCLVLALLQFLLTGFAFRLASRR